MSTLTELYRFVEKGFVDPFSRDNNLYFILDKSGSMNTLAVGSRTRMDIAKGQLRDVLLKLDEIRLERGIKMHLGVCAFSASSTDEIVRRDCDSAAIGELVSFVESITAGGLTPYDAPIRKAVGHFRVPSPGFRRAMFFITDGVPEPAASADNAARIAESMYYRTGDFSREVDNDVAMYGIAVDLFDTTQLAKLDNTPRDGIQSISSTASQGLYNALMAAEDEERLVWTFTSAPFPVEFAGEVFEPAAISHGEVESKEDIARANLEVNFDINNPAARRWMKDSVEAIVGLTVWQQDEDGETYVVWKGRLAGTRPSGSQIRLSFDSIFTSLSRPGLGARYQRMCRHALYGRGCRLSKATYAATGRPTAVVGSVVTVPEAAGYPNGYFSMGMLETPDGALRFIVNHTGNKLTLMRPMESLGQLFANQGYGLNYGLIYGGLQLKMYPGCNRSRATCNAKFNNLENYGGFDWIPTKNPFGGGSIV